MSARIAETTKTKKPIMSEPMVNQTGSKDRAMTLQKAIELVQLMHVMPTRGIDSDNILDKAAHQHIQEFNQAIALLLETAKDVLRCEDDGK